MNPQPTIIETHRLSAGYREKHGYKTVVREASLQITASTVTCLLGANGAGKSTLLRTLSGLQPPLSGTVRICGRDSKEISDRQRARLMGVVYTERTGAGALTVSETVALGRQPYTGFFGRLSSVDLNIVARSLEQVGMEHFAHRYFGTLSDGERQKIMIARALAQETPLLLLDEPTSFLDVASRLEVMALLKNLSAEQGKAILLSTHDVAEALSIATNIWLIMEDGQLIAGPKTEIIESGAMDRLFVNRGIAFDRDALDYRLR